MKRIESIRNWYARFERPISSLSLILGFVFDAITLRRVDTLWENLWTFGHLVIVAVFIILIHLEENEGGDEANPSKKHFWYVNILQFFFGGLLSTYLVFYFRSTDIFTTWPFIFILAIAFIANESMKRHYVKLYFQISLLFLSIYSFAIFLLPVVLHKIGSLIFLYSGLLSLVLIAVFSLFLFYFKKKDFAESKKIILFIVLAIFAAVNLLYFTNLIPPIPLSLKDGGIYHSVQRNQNGNYDVTRESYNFLDYFRLYKNFYNTQGSPVYAYSAIFSPSSLNITIVHEWQYYDINRKKWITDETINLPVVGGREGGFRTYSMRSNLVPGRWRVNVKTLQGQIIGSLRFNVLISDAIPILISEVKK